MHIYDLSYQRDFSLCLTRQCLPKRHRRWVRLLAAMGQADHRTSHARLMDFLIKVETIREIIQQCEIIHIGYMPM